MISFVFAQKCTHAHTHTHTLSLSLSLSLSAVQAVHREVHKIDESMTRQQTVFIMRRWFFDVHGPDKAHLWDNDETVVAWFDGCCDADGNITQDSQIARELKCVAVLLWLCLLLSPSNTLCLRLFC